MAARLNPFAHGSYRAVDTCALSLKWSFQRLLKLGEQRGRRLHLRHCQCSP